MKGFGTPKKNNKRKKTKNADDISYSQLINKALESHSQGDIPQAIKSYQLLIDKGISEPMVYANYAELNQQIGQKRKAVDLYRKSITLQPRDSIIHRKLCGLLYDLGKLKEAEESIRTAIRINPVNAFDHFTLGNILTDLGRLKEAELSMRMAIKIDPENVITHSNLGSILIKLGKLESARKSIYKSIELNPNYAISHFNLGSLLKDIGELKDAEKSTRRALKLKPDLVTAHFNLGLILKDLGKLKEAELSFLEAIKLNRNFTEAYSNLGIVLVELGKSKEGETYTRRAIELNPQNVIAHSNLGSILINLGKLKQAELSLLRAIELNQDHGKSYYILSTLKLSSNQNYCHEYLFSERILKNQNKEDLIYIYFARANVLHQQRNYKRSAESLELANQIKLSIYPSDSESIINKSKQLMIESKKYKLTDNKPMVDHESIFIVGMFRSGSTLVESILSMEKNVDDLGEVNILEEAFLEWNTFQQSKNPKSLHELYSKKVTDLVGPSQTSTNKWLYNYLYSGIISSQLNSAKIIHCYRNPLDNILSIYREHFSKGSRYSSSLIDCSKVYLEQDMVMTEYKKQYPKKIYDLNYDSLVTNPNQEIRSLISWLGWKWEESYLSPHLNPRSVFTASNVQVRSPINARSIGSWRNYQKMLQPAIDLITQTKKYRHLLP